MESLLWNLGLKIGLFYNNIEFHRRFSSTKKRMDKKRLYRFLFNNLLLEVHMNSLQRVILFMAFWLGILGLMIQPAQAGQLPQVQIQTNMGNIIVELDSKKAPQTVSNFLYYVKTGYYNNTIFHRVIDGFMIQGGGFTPDLIQKETNRQPIVNEANNGLSNKKYTISMARTQEPHSATSQFFINVVDNPSLDYKNKTVGGFGYAVFGRVIKGMDVVDRIKSVPTVRSGSHHDVPQSPIIIKSIVPVM